MAPCKIFKLPCEQVKISPNGFREPDSLTQTENFIRTEKIRRVAANGIIMLVICS